MTTDRELLEKAAKAAGIPLKADFADRFDYYMADPLMWNPLTDDGDALRLAVTLALDIEFQKPCGVAALRRNYVDGTVTSGYVSNIDADPYAATRRAIVRAAAAIGETK